MKKLLLVLLCMVPFIGFSQDMQTYAASNGKIYKIGDTVRVALGSMPDGNFKYVQASPPLFALPSRNANSLSARKDFANTNVVIRKIKKGAQLSGSEKVVFNVKVRGIITYDIWIEEAISACEVTPCAIKTTVSGTVGVADELLKLKSLLDAGAITTEEFNAQKKKLLAQ